MVCASNETVINTFAIGIAAFFGALTRVSLNSVFGPDGAEISSGDKIVFYDLAANVFGCFVLGCHVSLKQHLRMPGPLSLAISTGYAGSVTTFASWNYQIVRMIVAGILLEGFGALFVGVSLSFVSFFVGRDVGDSVIYVLLRRSRPSPMQVTADKVTVAQEEGDTSPHESERPDHGSNWREPVMIAILSFVLLLLTSLGIAGAVLDNRDSTRRSFWASAMFAPVGAVLRWRLSPLNRIRPAFPIGTFLANITAVLLDAAIGAALVVHSDSSREEVFYLSAIITGLGGSLSTVSTWIAEASALPRPQKYTYIMVSLVSAQLLGILVYGTAFWVHD